MTFTKDDLEKGKQICRKASQSPWRDGFDDGSGRIGDDHGAHITLEEHDPLLLPTCVIVGGDYEGIPIGVLKQVDVDFIIATREDYPRALAALEEAWLLLGNIEWLEHGGMPGECPRCRETKAHGHNPLCELGQTLRAAEEDQGE